MNVCVCVCLYTQYRFFVRATNIPEAEVSAELSLHVCFCTFAIVSLCSLSLTVEQSGKKTLCRDIFHASPFPSDPHWMSPTHTNTNYSQSLIRNSYSQFLVVFCSSPYRRYPTVILFHANKTNKMQILKDINKIYLLLPVESSSFMFQSIMEALTHQTMNK